MTIPTLARLRADGRLSALDEQLALAIGRAVESMGGESRPEVLLAAALLSARVGEGDVLTPPPRGAHYAREVWMTWNGRG